MILEDFYLKLKIDKFQTEYLKDISFECKNENITILGANGAGKTTLAKAIVGLYENDAIFIDDTPFNKLSSKKRAEILNYIPSKLEIFDEYISVKEYLYLSILNGIEEDQLDKVMKLLDIQHLENKSCKQLSSGESQLLLFASALLQNSTYTIFDEPTANLDSDKKINIFKALQNQTKGFNIVITHDLNLAYKLGYRIINIDYGTISFDGSSKEFFEPNNLQKFFGDSIKQIDGYYMVNY